MRRVPRLRDARAAWWAARAVRAVRAQLAAGAVRDVRLPPPPQVSPAAGRAVDVVLRTLKPSCLERALVLQRWLAGHGVARAVVVGTRGSGEDFGAHAWLEGEPAQAYVELTRIP